MEVCFKPINYIWECRTQNAQESPGGPNLGFDSADWGRPGKQVLRAAPSSLPKHGDTVTSDLSFVSDPGEAHA